MGDFLRRIVDVEHERIDPAAAMEFVADPAFGGFAMFVGRVREQNQGRAVTGVSYDVFEQLALVGFDDIMRRAQEQFGSRLKIYLAHARGRLGIGDVAVVVAVGTPHRDEAFRACRQVIEAVKHGSPIWKQEHYVDGSSEWSEGCSLCESHERDRGPESRHDGHAHG
ncbi:molybdopterin converting factor subunit 2 protein [Rhodanobacter thiooxydans]|uniref:Molybdopterin synthase catalytic subunit n=1 Tax=Rhodanobacter thiooxydans TaxID=416169 RepID=A0A154QM36_9GAMM|nr:molybdenum cofactor biosynthesis protein MoaE [Rhodanobacter thiooxydans]EIM02910.1 molybdopterin biosynthesis MoaE protein [Rhodanobacter thiooxydans LCS2]KZC25357.1 molybdopterin converting factor subunit 2 protein [Rhodanobacter thiooxydans]MCW0203161.1 molybdenum cofactor biosynthesis protein MoaE [Rhodanobacter thiooxydans]